jgi:hypothetical protein
MREMLGHADLAMTTRYVHATGDDKRQAIQRLVGNYWEIDPSVGGGRSPAWGALVIAT